MTSILDILQVYGPWGLFVGAVLYCLFQILRGHMRAVEQIELVKRACVSENRAGNIKTIAEEIESLQKQAAETLHKVASIEANHDQVKQTFDVQLHRLDTFIRDFSETSRSSRRKTEELLDGMLREVKDMQHEHISILRTVRTLLSDLRGQ